MFTSNAENALVVHEGELVLLPRFIELAKLRIGTRIVLVTALPALGFIALMAAQTARDFSLSFLVLALLIAGAFVFLIVRDIVVPINAMTATMRALLDGTSIAQIPAVERRDEFGEMARVFRDLIEATAVTRAELAESRQRYDLCVRGSDVGLWDWNVKTNTLFWSDRFKAIVGIADRAFVPELSSFENRLHPDDHDRIMDALRRHIQFREDYDVEYLLRREVGDYVWIHARGQAVWDDAGNPTRMAGSVQDITKRKATEDQLARYARELERSNQELDQFAYVASHDLKAPLRVIENTAEWLEEDLQDTLSDKQRKYLSMMRNRVRRMEKLLDDLLNYARVGRASDDRYTEVVTGEHLLADILELLAPPPSFRVEASPQFAAISAARMPLQQVLYNLINNAIKHHDRETGTITLGAERVPGFYRFTVRDDGPGIPPQYQRQIFDMFITLKPRDEVEGSGMGLAFVKKTVEYFGGTIEVSSGDERGATFIFTWPNKNQAIAGIAA